MTKQKRLMLGVSLMAVIGLGLVNGPAAQAACNNESEFDDDPELDDKEDDSVDPLPGLPFTVYVDDDGEYVGWGINLRDDDESNDAWTDVRTDPEPEVETTFGPPGTYHCAP